MAFDPNYSRAVMALGSVMQSHQNHDEALSKYTICAKAMPESPHMWSNIGMLHFLQEKFLSRNLFY